jgi:hypothetical protein
LSRSLAMIEDRRPSMWWSASTTMRLAHTPELDTLAGGTPIRIYRQCPFSPGWWLQPELNSPGLFSPFFLPLPKPFF